MQELIQEIRKNRNTKYYKLLVSYFSIINQDPNHKVRFSVDDIIKDVNISRPTFYTYYNDVEEFYLDLMDIISKIWPLYMTKLFNEIEESDFHFASFQARMGITISNMRKIAGRFPKVMEEWNSYFNTAVREMGAFYSTIKKVPKEEGERLSRMVLNELILHDDVYYDDFEKYKALLLEQKII